MMAEANTRADALHVFLSGAASDGAAQADPNLSLGNFRSSTRALDVAWAITTTMTTGDITVLDIGGENGTGAGTLTASAVDGLKWTPPGATQGVEVTIANGETKLIEAGGSEPEKYILVKRTSATDLTGSSTITISDIQNNVYGMDDVSTAEQAAGDDEYRCWVLKNVSAVAIQNLKVKISTGDALQKITSVAQLPASGAGTISAAGGTPFSTWPSSGLAMIKTTAGAVRELIYFASRTAAVLTVAASGRGLGVTSAAAGASDDTIDSVLMCEIGLDAPTSQPSGSFVDNTGADEDTPPAGVVFTTPITDAEALDIGTLEPGYIYAIWVHRQTAAGATSLANILSSLVYNFDSA